MGQNDENVGQKRFSVVRLWLDLLSGSFLKKLRIKFGYLRHWLMQLVDVSMWIHFRLIFKLAPTDLLFFRLWMTLFKFVVIDWKEKTANTVTFSFDIFDVVVVFMILIILSTQLYSINLVTTKYGIRISCTVLISKVGFTIYQK